MSFQPVFDLFWKSKESIDNYTYAKLTLAKTIGDTELKNIYVRPVLQERILVSITARYKTEESFHTLMRRLLYWSVYEQPFLTLTFTTENDITFKLNKKKSGTIIEQAPTFKKCIGCHSRNEEKDFM
jgi:hypothetical protein